MNEALPAARVFRYDEIAIGASHERVYVITPDLHSKFLSAFHDHSPVHVDEAFAQSRGFAGPVMHGAVLNGFLSHFVGMFFPGKFSLLLAVDVRFSNPSYLHDSISVLAIVSHKMDSRHLVVLDVTLTNVTRHCLAARGRLQVMIKDGP